MNINEILKSDYDLLCKDYKKATKKIEKLEEENKEYRLLIEMENKREYRSKFLKDFQKEKGKNVFPDYDEIYKRYDDYKARIDKAIERLEELQNEIFDGTRGNMVRNIIDILKGSDKSE